VFPHVVRYADILIGSRDTIDSNPDSIRTRMSDPSVRAYYAAAGVDIRSLMERYIGRPPERFDPSHDRSALIDINTDLFPRDEFDVPLPSMWGTQRERR
jgi:hypothetical protein